jgi:hypothetical protein
MSIEAKSVTLQMINTAFKIANCHPMLQKM